MLKIARLSLPYHEVDYASDDAVKVEVLMSINIRLTCEEGQRKRGNICIKWLGVKNWSLESFIGENTLFTWCPWVLFVNLWGLYMYPFWLQHDQLWKSSKVIRNNLTRHCVHNKYSASIAFWYSLRADPIFLAQMMSSVLKLRENTKCLNISPKLLHKTSAGIILRNHTRWKLGYLKKKNPSLQLRASLGISNSTSPSSHWCALLQQTFSKLKHITVWYCFTSQGQQVILLMWGEKSVPVMQRSERGFVEIHDLQCFTLEAAWHSIERLKYSPLIQKSLR